MERIDVSPLDMRAGVAYASTRAAPYDEERVASTVCALSFDCQLPMVVAKEPPGHYRGSVRTSYEKKGPPMHPAGPS